METQLCDTTKMDVKTLQRGVRGVAIAPKLFTFALEDIFKKLNWYKYRWCILKITLVFLTV